MLPPLISGQRPASGCERLGASKDARYEIIGWQVAVVDDVVNDEIGRCVGSRDADDSDFSSSEKMLRLTDPDPMGRRDAMSPGLGMRAEIAPMDAAGEVDSLVHTEPCKLVVELS
jgi:hypothetical protein